MEFDKNLYFVFWMKNTLTAVIGAIVFGYVLIGISPYIFSILLILFIGYAQIRIVQHFIGRFRGHFEFICLENTIHKKGAKILKQNTNFPTYISVRADEFSSIGTNREDVYREVLNKITAVNDQYKQFFIFMRWAKSAYKEIDDAKENMLLTKALTIDPRNIVALYRLGSSYEKLGDAQSAIESYNLAYKTLRDSNTQRLKEFIEQQIQRIENKGVCKRPPILGCRYMIY